MGQTGDVTGCIVVAVGGTNALKVDATQGGIDRAAQGLKARGAPAKSGVNEQPLGLEECRRGALNRALGALYEYNTSISDWYAGGTEEPEASYGVGIENCMAPVGASHWDQLLFSLMCAMRWLPVKVPGVRRLVRRWLLTLTFFDVAVVAVVCRFNSKVSYSLSPGIQAPTEDVVESIFTRCTVTAGKFIAKRTGWSHDNWHRPLMHDLAGRQDLLEEGVFVGFASRS